MLANLISINKKAIEGLFGTKIVHEDSSQIFILEKNFYDDFPEIFKREGVVDCFLDGAEFDIWKQIEDIRKEMNNEEAL